MNITGLRETDAGLSPDLGVYANAVEPMPTETSYCIRTTRASFYYYQIGRAIGTNAAITEGACPWPA